MAFGRLLTLGLLAALAGCMASQPPTPVAPPKSTLAAGDAGRIVRPAPPPPEPTRIYVRDPQQLVGLATEDAERLVGRPSTVHDEPPATVWRYEAGECALELFFYSNVADDTPRTLSFSVQPESDDGNRGCLEAVALRYQPVGR